jgi:nitroimidazol reductase NimA-like FMN-containing flavoprotein (pyridoxamine 5'-phosphate oxidase superfamily)
MPRPDIRLTPDEQEAFLRRHRKCALATLDKNGFPHIVAMNFVHRDGAFYMTSYGKAQKVLNVRRNRKVAVMAESGRRYSELRGVMIRGDCELVEDAPSVEAAMRAIRQHSSGETDAQIGPLTTAPKRVVLKVVPKKISSWDHGKLGGVY